MPLFTPSASAVTQTLFTSTATQTIAATTTETTIIGSGGGSLDDTSQYADSW